MLTEVTGLFHKIPFPFSSMLWILTQKPGNLQMILMIGKHTCENTANQSISLATPVELSLLLTLSHMASEVLFTIWQGGQLDIPSCLLDSYFLERPFQMEFAGKLDCFDKICSTKKKRSKRRIDIFSDFCLF